MSNSPYQSLTRRDFASLFSGLVLSSTYFASQHFATNSGFAQGNGAAAATGQTLQPSAMQARHPWGKCVPGASKKVRVVSESLDGKGKVTGTTTTDTYSFLEELTDQDFTLRIEVTVEVGGKRFNSQPQSVKQGYFGEAPGQSVTFKKIRDEEITLLGRPVTVENREVTVQTEKQRRTTVIHFSDTISPHVLKCVSMVTNGDVKTPLSTTQVEVLATGMPYRVLGDIREASFVRTVHTQPKGGSTITMEVHCADVPGGVVAHTSKELDESGQLLKRSTLELLEFDLGDRDNVEIMGRRARAQHRSRSRETVPQDRSRRR